MKFCLTQLRYICKMFANWEEVFESFSEIEKDEIRTQENISDEKICADIENYFEEYVGHSTANCYGNEVPDVVNGLFQGEFFMGIELESEDFTIENIIENVPIEKNNNEGVCFTSHSFQ